MSSVKAAQRIPEPTWNATCGSFPLEAAAIPASAKHTSAPMPNPNIRAQPLSKRRKRHREEPQPDVPQTDDVVKLVSPERVGKAERARSRFGTSRNRIPITVRSNPQKRQVPMIHRCNRSLGIPFNASKSNLVCRAPCRPSVAPYSDFTPRTDPHTAAWMSAEGAGQESRQLNDKAEPLNADHSPPTGRRSPRR